MLGFTFLIGFLVCIMLAALAGANAAAHFSRNKLLGLMSKLGETLSESGDYYYREALERSRSEELVRDVHQAVRRGVDWPQDFWQRVAELCSALTNFAREEFDRKRVLQELQKCSAQIDALSQRMSKDDHLLLSARHLMKGLAAFQSDNEYKSSTYKEAAEALPHIQRLISEMKKSTGDPTACANLRLP